MPGTPTSKGEGLIRTHDLLEVLRSDIGQAYETLEANRESQYLRRCVVRAIFSFIEAVVECIKVEVRSTIRGGGFAKPLSAREMETLGALHLVPPPIGRFLALDDNIKRTFRLAAKVWGLEFQLRTGGEDFRDFLAAKRARDRLTHPRTFYDVEVMDHDMHCHTVAGMWLQSEFKRLFRARIESLSKDLPEDDRAAFLQHFAGKEKRPGS